MIFRHRKKEENAKGKRRWRWRPRLPRSLGGQIILLLVMTVVISQIINLILVAGERVDAFRRGASGPLVNQTIVAIELLQESDAYTQARLLRALRAADRRFVISPEPVVKRSSLSAFSTRIAERIERQTGLETRVNTRFFDNEIEFDNVRDRFRERYHEWREQGGNWRDDAAGSAQALIEENDRRRPPRQFGPQRGRDNERVRVDQLLLSVELESGRWLNAEWRLPKRDLDWLKASIQSNLILALVLSMIAFFVVRRVTRPMKRLAKAADELGRGADVPPLPERGPREIRQATTAFNSMQDRLTRFVKDRTQMLAAISHDLRTPITSLRLRAELLDDEEARDNMVRTLDEMQAMTESVLAFARDDAAREDLKIVALDQLIADCAEQVAPQNGSNVAEIVLEDLQPIHLKVRPVALKRAIANLMENAIIYGNRATISLSRQLDHAVLRIHDQGPGIPEDRHEEMFKPFARMESSRNRQTGGTGLGLAIARTVLRGHGGDITLQNGETRGLIVTVTLPAS